MIKEINMLDGLIMYFISKDLLKSNCKEIIIIIIKEHNMDK
jgi:hypothetical protein